MTPDNFRQLLLEMDDSELVRTHIVTTDPGPNIPATTLRHIETVIRAKFQLTIDQRVSAIVVGSAKLGFSFIEKRRACPEFCVNGVWVKGCSSGPRTG